MHTVTLYDSAFLHKNKNLSPVHHLQCDLALHSNSIEMLRNMGLSEGKNFPNKLHCVLSDLPGISFDSKWDTGAGVKMFDPLGINDPKQGKFTKILQVVSKGNFVPIVQTNEFTQQAMTNGSRITLNLKFNVYTDTYNNRYNFESTPYETWMKMLYFSTAPLVRSTYANYLQQLQNAIASIDLDELGAMTDDLGKFLSSGAVTVKNLLPFTDISPDSKERSREFIEKIESLSEKITKYIMNSEVIGQLCWDVKIPKYICSTINTTSPVYWNIESFSIEPSVKFTRGMKYSDENKPIGDAKVYRPRPLYMTFNVTLTTNQIMTRDQYLKLLCGNTYKTQSQE